MRILNISAHKPDSTGSGVYLAEMVRCELSAGHAAAVVAGVDASDEPTLPEGAEPYFVRFNTEALPFNVCGMSDVMPYFGAKSIGPPIFLWGFWAIAYAVAFFVSAMHSRTKTSACGL